MCIQVIQNSKLLTDKRIILLFSQTCLESHHAAVGVGAVMFKLTGNSAGLKAEPQREGTEMVGEPEMVLCEEGLGCA